MGRAPTDRAVRRGRAWVLAAALIAAFAVAASSPPQAATSFSLPPQGAVATVHYTDSSLDDRGELGGAVSDGGTGAAARRITSAGAGAAPKRGVTPGPLYSFTSGVTPETRIDVGGSPADSNLAVSQTHVCTTTRAAFACYTKGGELVAPAGVLDPRAYSAQEFFAAAGVPIGTAFDDSTTDVAKDGRIVFDPFRDRFFMVFQTRESPARLMIAVSKSQDPRDGWFTYADVVGRAGLEVQDYQKLGVTSEHLLVSSELQPVGGARTMVNFLYTADDLASGAGYVRGEWQHVDAWRPAPALNQSGTSAAFWAARDDDTHVSVWAVQDGVVYRRTVSVSDTGTAVNGTQLGGASVVYDNIGNTPQNADYRAGLLTLVSNDSDTWSGQPAPSNVVKLVQIDVSNYFNAPPYMEVVRDRRFGRSSTGDPAGAVFDYGWPAVASNALGDLVVGQIRSNSSIYPQLRASVWESNESDISPSTLVRSGASALSQFHMAGAAADPRTIGVYVSQQVGAGLSPCGGPSTGNGPCWVVVMAKLLGQNLADLIATKIKAPLSMSRGESRKITVRVANEGDWRAPATFARLRLSEDAPISDDDHKLARFRVPRIDVQSEVKLRVPIKIPQNFPKGFRFIGAELDIKDRIAEQSTQNNRNPFLGFPHGNAEVEITG